MRTIISCPCENCKYYVYGKRHPNPNAYDEHYCERLHKAIYQHRGNAYHYSGQWIIPCGFEQNLFKRKDDEYLNCGAIMDGGADNGCKKV